MMFASSRSSAFSLVEVTLALGVAAFCLLAVFGLLPIGLNSDRNSTQQTAAASLARAIAADLRVTPKTLPATDQVSPRYGITVPATGAPSHTIFLKEDGTAGAQDASADPTQSPRFRATLYFNASGASLREATGVRILLTWPAMADKVAGTPPTNYSGAYETFTALDRN
jgi:type II secretory pathway pseudopilin PulG